MMTHQPGFQHQIHWGWQAARRHAATVSWSLGDCWAALYFLSFHSSIADFCAIFLDIRATLWVISSSFIFLRGEFLTGEAFLVELLIIPASANWLFTFKNISSQTGWIWLHKFLLWSTRFIIIISNSTGSAGKYWPFPPQTLSLLEDIQEQQQQQSQSETERSSMSRWCDAVMKWQ